MREIEGTVRKGREGKEIIVTTDGVSVGWGEE